MADVDTTQILVALILAVLSLGGVWIANGHLARTFEKRKKKYEVKLEKYSVVIETFALLTHFGHVARLHMSVSKLLESNSSSESVERDYDRVSILPDEKRKARTCKYCGKILGNRKKKRRYIWRLAPGTRLDAGSPNTSVHAF